MVIQKVGLWSQSMLVTKDECVKRLVSYCPELLMLEECVSYEFNVGHRKLNDTVSRKGPFF